MNSGLIGSVTNEIIALPEDLKYEEGMANALLARGVCRKNTSEYNLALEDLLQARELFYRTNSYQGAGRATMWIGLVHQRAGNLMSALKYFLNALQIFEEQKDDSGVAKCLAFIGRAYLDVQDYDNALNYLYQALNIRSKLPEAIDEGALWEDLGRAYLYLGNVEKALEYCEKSLDIRHATIDVRGLSAAFYLRGEIYGRLLREAPISIRSFWISLRLAREINDRWAEGKASCAMGRIYRELSSDNTPNSKYFASAETHLCNALRIGKEIYAQEIMIDAHDQLSKLYRDAKYFEKALYHCHEHHAIKESLMTQQSKQALQNLIFGYEIEKNQKSSEIHRLKNIELVNSNSELAKLNNEKNEFLALVAHDLKNPLTGIVIAISLLREHRKSMSDAQINDQLRAILSTADSMKDLITKLLDVNAIESGCIELLFETVAVKQIAIELVEEYRARLSAKQISVVCKISDAVKIVVDRRCMKEILENLLSNAIKFSPPKCGIFITAEIAGKEALISLRDEGPGIPEKDFEKLFTKFARLSAKPTAGESSTGLGLSIVKKLTELLGGRVGCKSVAGEGATFTVALPVANHPSELCRIGKERDN